MEQLERMAGRATLMKFTVVAWFCHYHWNITTTWMEDWFYLWLLLLRINIINCYARIDILSQTSTQEQMMLMVAFQFTAITAGTLTRLENATSTLSVVTAINWPLRSIIPSILSKSMIIRDPSIFKHYVINELECTIAGNSKLCWAQVAYSIMSFTPINGYPYPWNNKWRSHPDPYSSLGQYCFCLFTSPIRIQY